MIDRQRMGEGLNDLSFEQLTELTEDVDNSIKLIRERKVNLILYLGLNTQFFLAN